MKPYNPILTGTIYRMCKGKKVRGIVNGEVFFSWN